MRFAATLAFVALTAPVIAQDDLRVLPVDSEPRKMLTRFQLAEAQKHFDARRQTILGLKTPDDIAQRQKYLKGKFIEALGGFPEKTPLNAKVVGELKADGFRVEKVIYESLPNHHVTANLYLPEGKGPFPGVLLPCGHSANGKAADAYQRAAILLAKNGMVVLCYDPIGQGERYQILDKSGRPAVKSSTSEHTLVGVGALLVGWSTASYRIWDGIRSLDYLVGRPEVDPKRLGCTGNSGGGTLTAYLMALDERIVCAAPSCYITSLERLFATIGPQDAEQNITGQVAFGMEHADYLTLRAPRPTLMCVATHDFFDIQGAWTTFREASLIYGKLGYGERVALFEFEDKHGFSRPRREAAARWMSRWLLNKEQPIKEGELSVFKDADLQCTRSGQVLEDFNGKSAFHLNVEEARALATQRAKFAELSDKERQGIIRGLLGLPEQIQRATSKALGSTQHPTYRVGHGAFDTETGIRVPALSFIAAKKGEKPAFPRELTIYLDERGMIAEAKPGGALERLLTPGGDVLALDLRGLGETAPGMLDAKKPAFFGVDFKDSFLALHLNRPLLGQRVKDLLAVIDREAQGRTSISVVARGMTGPIALHAAALDRRISSVRLENSLLSWMNVVQTPVTYNQLSSVVPGVLRSYDLPDLAATLAPRPLEIVAPVDAALRPVATDECERVYKTARDAYARQNAAKSLTLRSSP